MAQFFRTCLDGHTCENGSSCAENPLREGTYYCDCTTGGGDFAGLFCEFSADTYCQLPQETSSAWFCTNGGTCVLATEGGGNGQPATWNCDCTGDYEGPHCQFVKGNVPTSWPGFDFDPTTVSTTTAKSSGGGGLHAGVIVAIVLVVLIFVALVAFVVVRKRRRMAQEPAAAQNAARDPSQALKLDADGSILQSVMESMSRTPTTTAVHTYDYENGDAASVEVERPVSPVGAYSDDPKANGRSSSSSRRGYGGNIL